MPTSPPRRPRYAHPVARMLLVAALAAATALGLSRLELQSDPLDLLPGDLPEVRGLRIVHERFAQADELIIALAADDAEAAGAAAESLGRFLAPRDDLVRSAAFAAPWESEGGTAGAGELAAYLILNRDPGQNAELLQSLRPENIDATLQRTLETLATGLDYEEVMLASYDPFGIARSAFGAQMRRAAGNSEFSLDGGRLRLVYAESREPLADYRDAIAWVAEVRAAIRAWRNARPEAARGIAVTLTGEPAFAAEISSSMERDMRTSGAATLALVAGIFFLFYRRIRPLAALVALLAGIFVLTLGAAGFALGRLTVISAGFASILIGLTVDYGVVLYQRWLASEGDTAAVRRAARPAILWAAATTAAAFVALAASGLPGVAELGILVAIGVAIGAVVMLAGFLRLGAGADRTRAAAPPTISLSVSRALGVAVGVGALALAAGLPARGFPKLALGEGALRPKHSEAYNTLEMIEAKSSAAGQSLTVAVKAGSPAEMRRALEALESRAADAGIAPAAVPIWLWPSDANQAASRATLDAIAVRADELREAALAAGFTEEAFVLTEEILGAWRRFAIGTDGMIWPPGDAAARAARRLTARDAADGSAFSLAVFRLEAESAEASIDSAAAALLAADPGIVLPADWSLLSRRLDQLVRDNLGRLGIGLVIALVIAIAAALRSVLDAALTFGVIALNFLCLLGGMAWLGLEWNFINLGALLLALGAGVDYSLHLLFALRDARGDIEAAYRSTGAALLVCGISTAVGFGSLGWASNAGLASLGIVCALALSINALVSLFLLPHARAACRQLRSGN